METSDSSLSSEWDVINFNSDNIEEIGEESSSEAAAANDCKNDLGDSLTKGSCVEPLEEADADNTTDVVKETNEKDQDEILNDTDINHYGHILSDDNINRHNDSNSSSDVDVIEESPEDLHHSRMLMPPMDYLRPALAGSGSLVPASAPAPNTAAGRNNTISDGRLVHALMERFLRIPRIKVYTFIIFLSFSIAISLEICHVLEEKVRIKKEIIESKSLGNLEDQITDLKRENNKLTSSIQSLIVRLEEQTALFENANNMRKKDPYKAEIDKLKEQVNILRIDNEDLQQQLVRIRYGAYSPYPGGARESIPEANLDQNDNETSAEVLSEEIEKLKKQLYSEVGDLKTWKESINNIIKQLDDKEKKDHDNTKAKHEDKRKKHTNSESDKDDEYHDWSWKDWKKNFGDTFDSINFPQFSKYASVDGEKVKHVFESVGNYFKKAQDKTRKMFNNYKQKGKDDVWEFLSSLRKKWAEMKEDFFKNEFKKGPVPPNSNKKFEKPKENEKKKFTGKADKMEVDDSVVEFLMNHKDMKKIIGDDPNWKAKFKKFLEKEEELTENWNKPENSWIFNRAEVRNILREKDAGNKEEATNWFLRKKKTAREDGSFDHDLFDNVE